MLSNSIGNINWSNFWSVLDEFKQLQWGNINRTKKQKRKFGRKLRLFVWETREARELCSFFMEILHGASPLEILGEAEFDLKEFPIRTENWRFSRAALCHGLTHRLAHSLVEDLIKKLNFSLHCKLYSANPSIWYNQRERDLWKPGIWLRFRARSAVKAITSVIWNSTDLFASSVRAAFSSGNSLQIDV